MVKITAEQIRSLVKKGFMMVEYDNRRDGELLGRPWQEFRERWIEPATMLGPPKWTQLRFQLAKRPDGKGEYDDGITKCDPLRRAVFHFRPSLMNALVARFGEAGISEEDKAFLNLSFEALERHQKLGLLIGEALDRYHFTDCPIIAELLRENYGSKEALHAATVLRLLWYPPQKAEEDTVAGKHNDRSLFAILTTSEGGRLFGALPDGSAVDLTPQPGYASVFLGERFEKLVEQKRLAPVRAMPHWATSEEWEERLSLVSFHNTATVWLPESKKFFRV